MKNRFTWLLLFAVVIAFAACDSEVRLLMRGTGVWDVKNFTQNQYTNGSLTSSIVQDSPDLSYTFRKDGSGSVLSTSFNWHTNLEGDSLFMDNSSGYPRQWAVIEGDAKNQTWFSEFFLTSSGNDYRVETIMVLEKSKEAE